MKAHSTRITRNLSVALLAGALITGSFVYLAGCNKSSATTDATDGQVTENTVATVGGAVTSSSTDSVAWNETLPRPRTWGDELKDALDPLKDAWAFSTCATVIGSVSGCSALTNTVTMTYGTSGCVFPPNKAPWIGGTELTLTPTSVVAACGVGKFPAIGKTLTGGSVTAINRTYLGSLGGTTVTARTTAAGTVTVVLDTSAPSNATFVNANTTGTTSGTGGWDFNIDAGGGYTRTSVSAGVHSLGIAIRLVAYAGSAPTGTALFDHTISTASSATADTPLTVTISGNTHTVTGTVTLQHNLAKFTAASTFAAVAHDVSSGCCYPTSGTVTTTFSGGTNNGKTQAFTFSAATCTLGTLGQVSFTDVNGVTGTYQMTHCF